MRFNNYYQKNLIFQQGRPFIVKGTGATNSLKVFLKSGNRVIKPKLKIEKDGCFEAIFDSQGASNTPFSLIGIDQNKVEISPIYSGDVFLCLGQSNMSLPLKYSENLKEFSLKEKIHNNAYLTINDEFVNKDGFVYRPENTLSDLGKSSKWRSVKEEASDASALSYILLSMLDEKVDYPIGAIVVACGGVSIDTFLSFSDIAKNKDIKEYLLKTNKYCELENKYDFTSYTRTAGIFNEKISPILDASFKSVIYYQGENSAFNLESAKYFKSALNILIDSYRERFNDKNLPFFLMGIADEFYCYGDKYGYPYITEVLSNFEKEYTYLVPVYDIAPKWLVPDGNVINHPIHPSNKKDFAKRLFDIVYYNLYKNESYFAPKVVKAVPNKNGLILNVDNFGSSFKKDKEFHGFFVAGEDKVYQKADAKCIDKNQILLSSINVKKPLYYLYGLYQYSYLANCKARNGLPLLPSRSFVENMDKVHYQTNPVFGCDTLKIIENNFGADAGGGFKINLWDKGEIYPNVRVTISLDKTDKITGSSSINVKAKLTNKSFGFFSVKANIGYGALFHPLGDYSYLNVSLKSKNNIDFYGILFRYHGHIYKLPIYGVNTPQVNLDSNWKTYSLNLKDILDGSLSPITYKKEIVESISSIEFYFRSNENEVQLLIDNLNFSNSPSFSNKLSNEKQVKDMAINVSRGSNGK